MTLGQKMRWIAGGIYAVLSVYTMLTMRFLLIFSQNMNPIGIANYPAGWIVQLLLIFATGAAAVWMFSKKEYLSDSARRAIVIVTALIIAFELISYSSQTELIYYTLYVTFPKMAENKIWSLVFIVVRMLLYILAAFFVTSSKDMEQIEETTHEESDEDTDNSEEVLEIVEEEVTILEEDKKDE